MAMDLDMALSSSEGPDLIMALVVIQVTQLGMAPATARSLDTNVPQVVAQTLGIHMAFGINMSHGKQHRLCLQQVIEPIYNFS